MSQPKKIVVQFKVVVKSVGVMGEYIALHGLVPGNELPDRFKGKIPPNEVWIRKDIYDDRKQRDAVLAHEQAELTLMTQKGLTYKKAHNRVERKTNPPKLPSWFDAKKIYGVVDISSSRRFPESGFRHSESPTTIHLESNNGDWKGFFVDNQKVDAIIEKIKNKMSEGYEYGVIHQDKYDVYTFGQFVVYAPQYGSNPPEGDYHNI